MPGAIYTLLGREGSDDEWRELARVVVPGADPERRAVVESIDPGAPEVPANLLRFAVTFSVPMEDGSAAGHLHLLDESGAELPGTVLETPELWSRDRRRLTVLLEPGRVKRGLQPNAQAGAPMHDGGEVTLVVDSAVRDADGAFLVEEARRTFRVGPAVRARVDPARWQVAWPEEASGRLIIAFDRPLDRALVQRCLRVIDADGGRVTGAVSLDPETTVWTFTPAPGAFVGELHVDTRLEDLAGNSVRRVFDRDLDSPADATLDAPFVVLRR